MIRALIDQFMRYEATFVIIVLAHVAALVWALGRRKGIGPVLGLNLIVAGWILAYNADQVGIMLHYSEYNLMALTAFALATFLLSAAALYGLRIPGALIWLAFGGNFILSVLLMTFALTFKMNRLF